MAILDIRGVPAGKVTGIKFDDSDHYLKVTDRNVVFVDSNSCLNTPICTMRDVPDLIKALEHLYANN